MEKDKINIYIILIGGIPGIGKTYFSKKIMEKYKDLYNIKYLNFDNEEKINSNNYFNYKSMRINYINKFILILNNIHLFERATIILLDDNFYLKSMRKLIYKCLIQRKESLFECNKFEFYYCEILLKTNNIQYALNLNSNRVKNEIIPNEIIIKMNNEFEYNPLFLDYKQIIIDVDNKNILNNIDIFERILNTEEYKISLIEKDFNIANVIEKNNSSKFIDSIEEGIRRKISEFLNSSKDHKQYGKTISILKKRYMSLISSYIKNSNLKVSWDDIIEIKIIIDDYIDNLMDNNHNANENIKEDLVNQIIDLLLEKIIKQIELKI